MSQSYACVCSCHLLLSRCVFIICHDLAFTGLSHNFLFLFLRNSLHVLFSLSFTALSVYHLLGVASCSCMYAVASPYDLYFLMKDRLEYFRTVQFTTGVSVAATVVCHRGTNQKRLRIQCLLITAPHIITQHHIGRHVHLHIPASISPKKIGKHSF